MNTIRISVAGILWLAVCCSAMLASEGTATQEKHAPMVKMDDAKLNDWLTRWDKNITVDARNRYCDKAMGEDIGWLMTPFVDGFYYGYVATKDPRWVDMLVDWTDSWVRRAVKEPDGYLGWPRPEAAGTKVDDLDDFNADSMLGEAMALRPAVLMAGEILNTPALKEKYGVKAESYIKLSEKIYKKWDQRGGWRETKDGAVISVVLPYGIDRKTGNWTEGFASRNAPGNGFSHPNNKANHVARWLLAMSEVTGKAVYKERAEKWFTLMKSRMKLKASGTYEIWNYWEPAGPWDYKPNGSPKHWVGVHPNPGYYQIDLTGIVDAYDHDLVFTRQDIEHLIATAIAEKRYWDALVPYSETIQRKFEEGMKPDSWGGLSAAAKYLMFQARLHKGGRVSATTHRAATYYVDQGNPVASDNNAGTAAQPWKTIQQAADTVTAGDTVIVQGGTYTEQVGIFAPHAGTPGNLITLKAGPGDKVVIDGGKKNSFGFRMGASHIRIDGFEIVNVTGHGILAGWSDGSSLGVEIVNNTVHDCGNNPDTAAIYYAGGSGGLIQGNHLYNNAGDGITFPNIAGGITIRNNRIHHNEVDGIKGGGGGLIVIEGNTINNMTSVLHHGDGMQLMGMKGTLVVRDNTVWDCTQDIYCDDYSQPAGSQPWGDVYIYGSSHKKCNIGIDEK